jgi:Zn-dependent protease/predicted transcriptional regulator
MRWSWRLLRVAGIGIYIHVTFFLLLLWAGWNGFAPRHDWVEALNDVVFILTLFVIVVLHELGHALTARRFGIATRDITLLPIGGVARLERMPEDPKQELAVALAGPAVNVLLAILLFCGLALSTPGLELSRILTNGGNFFVRLMWVNVLLAVFNLLPAFPMDGGRVLRALLAIRMNYVRATRVAASIGQGMAFLFGLAGLFGNPFLVLIAVFVWMGAGQEASMVQMKSALNGIRVGQVMITDFRTLLPEDTLSRAVEFLLAGYQQDFPVASEGRLVGMLSRSALVDGLSRLGPNMPVADAMSKEFATVNPNELAETVFTRLQANNSRALPVLENGQLLGILTTENVGEYLMVQTALHNEPSGRRIGLHMTERHAA